MQFRDMGCVRTLHPLFIYATEMDNNVCCEVIA